MLSFFNTEKVAVLYLYAADQIHLSKFLDFPVAENTSLILNLPGKFFESNFKFILLRFDDW